MAAMTALKLVVMSCSLVTICLLIWLLPPVFTLGGFAFMTVGWVALGPPLGLLASLSMIGSFWALRRMMHSKLAVVIASIVGWSVTFLTWLLLGFSSLDGTGLAVSGVVAIVGCVSSTAIAWPRWSG